MQRDKAFNLIEITLLICRQDFQNFTEFVALHYALSHRDDTEYWKQT